MRRAVALTALLALTACATDRLAADAPRVLPVKVRPQPGYEPPPEPKRFRLEATLVRFGGNDAAAATAITKGLGLSMTLTRSAGHSIGLVANAGNATPDKLIKALAEQGDADVVKERSAPLTAAGDPVALADTTDRCVWIQTVHTLPPPAPEEPGPATKEPAKTDASSNDSPAPDPAPTGPAAPNTAALESAPQDTAASGPAVAEAASGASATPPEPPPPPPPGPCNAPDRLGIAVQAAGPDASGAVPLRVEVGGRGARYERRAALAPNDHLLLSVSSGVSAIFRGAAGRTGESTAATTLLALRVVEE